MPIEAVQGRSGRSRPIEAARRREEPLYGVCNDEEVTVTWAPVIEANIITRRWMERPKVL